MKTMADLRAQLRRIEAASPPDLWAGIEARVREERPQMDTNVTSIDAFREPGWDRRRRLAAALVAAAVVTATVVAIWESFQTAPIEAPVGSTLPAGWIRCTNDVLGYSIGYPGEWHTTDMLIGEQDPSYACQWFSPAPFGAEGNVVTEGWGYPLEVGIRGSFDEQLAQTLDPEAARVITQEELVIGGHRAVRLEYETLVDLIADTGLHYEYLVELDSETSLVVHTTETRGVAGDYEENKTFVDDAVGSLLFSDPTPSA
jgi:hypothetical protein